MLGLLQRIVGRFTDPKIDLSTFTGQTIYFKVGKDSTSDKDGDRILFIGGPNGYQCRHDCIPIFTAPRPHGALAGSVHHNGRELTWAPPGNEEMIEGDQYLVDWRGIRCAVIQKVGNDLWKIALAQDMHYKGPELAAAPIPWEHVA